MTAERRGRVDRLSRLSPLRLRAAAEGAVRVMAREVTAVPGPFVSECFDTYRGEAITLTPDAKQIQALERSDFNHAFSPEGDALLFVG